MVSGPGTARERLAARSLVEIKDWINYIINNDYFNIVRICLSINTRTRLDHLLLSTPCPPVSNSTYSTDAPTRLKLSTISRELFTDTTTSSAA
jgi:hypothetical protein